MKSLLKEILDIKIYSCEILLQTSTNINKVDIYNMIRGINGVVTLTVRHSNFLTSKSNEKLEWSLIYIKFISNGDVMYDIKKIKQLAISHSNKEIFRFIPRSKTIKKK